jgi:Fe2+ transport system protein B
MQNTDKKLKSCLTTGLAKGWSGFVWMLKIVVPISLFTSLLAWSGWISRLDFILEPSMGTIGLPPLAALPLITGLLTGIYGAIAAMAPLPLTIDQMTLVAIFLLISHNLIQEGVVQHKSGLPFVKSTLFRLIASILMVTVSSWMMGLYHENGTAALANAPVLNHLSFFSAFKNWATVTLILSGKMLVIIVVLMMILEIMKSYNLIDRIVRAIVPVLKILGLSRQTGFLWLTAALFGLTYGAAVIVEEVKEGDLSKEELERLQISIGINHAMIEDAALFLSMGISLFWLYIPRLAAAIIIVQLLMIIKRLIFLPALSRVSLWFNR